MKTLILDYIQDPGHGWVALHRSRVREIEYTPTAYSYVSRDGSVYFLEEDCDAPRALALLKDKGYTVNLRSVYQQDTPIRRMRSAAS